MLDSICSCSPTNVFALFIEALVIALATLPTETIDAKLIKPTITNARPLGTGVESASLILMENVPITIETEMILEKRVINGYRIC
jgi:hypothetical protein